MVLTLASAPFTATMGVGATVALRNLSGAGCANLNYTNHAITAVSGNTVTLNVDGTGCTYTANSGSVYATDILVRVHRDLTLMEWIGEVWDVGGQGYASSAVNITSLHTATLPQTLQIGDTTAATVDLAYLRWYSGTIAVGSAPPLGSSGGNLGDWEFEGNGNDGSGNRLTVTFTSGVTYATTPVYGPACNAGTPQSFRAGFPALLNGSQSFPLDGGTSLSYVWQQIPSPLPDVHLQHLRWRGQATAAPTVTGTVFGPLDFQLTVTQSNGQSTACTVHHGAVATDSNGAVITATGNPALDNAIATLIGPQIQFNKNPWAYYDQAAAWDAAVQIAGMDVGYFDYWDVPLQGTVSVTTGTNIITGTGTNFLTTFCNSSGVSLGYSIIVWYPTGRVFNGVPETGRRALQVGSCQSDTQITIGTTAGPSTWVSDAQPGSGLQYATSNAAGSAWGYSAAPANYYDNVQAYYELYYRSGIDTYLMAARKFADRFWTCTQIDRGMAFNVSEWFPAQQGRSNAVSGLVLRALDTSDGHPDMWAGLHLIWTFTHSYLVTAYPGWVKEMWVAGLDPREFGYILAQAAYGALWDTDPTWQAYCRAMIESSFRTGSAGIWPQAEDPVQHAWLQYTHGMKSTFDGSCPYGWCGSNPNWSGSTVNLTNGSTTVSCTGSNCGWTAADFTMYTISGASCSSGSNCGYVPVLFTDGAAFPWDSSHTDADAYCYPNGCSFVDSNHFILDRPYDGVSGTHGWIFGVSGGALASDFKGMVGWGQLPYMEGILAWAFSLAGKAMVCTGTGVPTNCDNVTSAQAYANSIAAATWVSTYGNLPSSYGTSYYGGYPSCGNPVSGSNIWCTAGYTSLQSREIGGDSYRGLMNYFLLSPSSPLQLLIDNWYAGMWGKPGTSPLIPSPDGQYDNNFDGSGCSGCGGYLTDGPPYSQKFFGQHFGISDQASWPIVRTGGPLPSRWTTIYVSGRIGDVPGATKMQVTVTEPTGVADAPVVCTSSPCAVTAAQTTGNPMVQVTYLSANGSAVSSGQPFVVNVN